MIRTLAGVAALGLLLGGPAAAVAQHSVKEAVTPAPKEVEKPVRDLLGDKSVQFLDAKGEVVAELWFRKEVPSKATATQVQNGLTYRDLEEGTLFAVVRFARQAADYRKQKIKPGVYTLRLGFQPEDGDHMGTAPHPNFCLLVAADKDKAVDAFKDAKELRDASTETMGTSHPGVLLLFPAKDPGAAVKLANEPAGHWVLTFKQDLLIDGKKVPFYIGLALIGTSPAA
jgi:hypothetical protein